MQAVFNGFIAVSLLVLSLNPFALAKSLSSDKVKYVLAVKAEVEKRQVFVSLGAGPAGLSKLPMGDSVSVNGIKLSVKPFEKKGFWYTAEIPQALNYDFKIKHRDASVSEPMTIQERQFEPEFSSALQAGRDYAIIFKGPKFTSSQKMLLKLTSKRSLFGGVKKSVQLTGVVDGGKIIIPGFSTKNFGAGRAEVSLSIASDQSPERSSIKSSYVISASHPIEIAKRR